MVLLPKSFANGAERGSVTRQLNNCKNKRKFTVDISTLYVIYSSKITRDKVSIIYSTAHISKRQLREKTEHK